jgi:hypothetical protein
MNDPLRPCRKGRGERVRPARSGWRPAKHIFARRPIAQGGIVCINVSKTKGGARRTAPQPGQLRSSIILRSRVRGIQIAVGSIRLHAQRRGCGQEGVKTATKKTERTVKAVKWIFAVFQSEPAAAQSVPTKTGRGDFTAFALILRMGMGGRGGGKAEVRIMNSIWENLCESVALISPEKSNLIQLNRTKSH